MTCAFNMSASVGDVDDAHASRYGRWHDGRTLRIEQLRSLFQVARGHLFVLSSLFFCYFQTSNLKCTPPLGAFSVSQRSIMKQPLSIGCWYLSENGRLGGLDFHLPAASTDGVLAGCDTQRKSNTRAVSKRRPRTLALASYQIDPSAEGLTRGHEAMRGCSTSRPAHISSPSPLRSI